MKKFIVIGNPIDHSLSPELHNYWIRKNNIDAILLSPVNSTSNKIGIGWNKFKMLADISEKPVFALGGLNYTNDINTVKENGGHGIAAISYFNQLP